MARALPKTDINNPTFDPMMVGQQAQGLQGFCPENVDQPLCSRRLRLHSDALDGFAYLCTVNRLGIALVILGLALGLQLRGQAFNDLRKVGPALRGAPKLSVGLDSRRSFISVRDVQIFGLRASLDFDKRVRLGFGVYFLASDFTRTFTRLNAFGIPYTIPNARLKFTYISAFFEYVILSTKRWECSLPVHVGIGDVGFRGLPEEPKSVLLTEGTLLASYKIFPFFGLGGGVGYRQILAGGSLISDNFNSPTYNFGLKFWFGYLYEKYIKKKPPQS